MELSDKHARACMDASKGIRDGLKQARNIQTKPDESFDKVLAEMEAIAVLLDETAAIIFRMRT